MKITKQKYLQGFLAVTFVLALVRCIFPSVAEDKLSATATEVMKGNQTPASSSVAGKKETAKQVETPATSADKQADKALRDAQPVPSVQQGRAHSASRFIKPDGTPVKNRIYSVPGYSESFPDLQDVQIQAATKWGVSPVVNRKEAEERKSELVYVGSNPYFYVDKLSNSVPYLVPRASVLLQDIGRNFFDSLQIKGIPLHKVIATSVLRTKEDVTRLRGHNGNATENSCHLYGTTFDVCYNRYKTVEAPGEKRRTVQNDTLKYVLAEVLRDLREAGRCYIKYEVKQGCFHITVR